MTTISEQERIRGGPRRGSVSVQVLERPTCPVAVVPTTSGGAGPHEGEPR